MLRLLGPLPGIVRAPPHKRPAGSMPAARVAWTHGAAPPRSRRRCSQRCQGGCGPARQSGCGGSRTGSIARQRRQAVEARGGAPQQRRRRAGMRSCAAHRAAQSCMGAIHPMAAQIRCARPLQREWLRGAHVKPVALGGLKISVNLQWQREAAARKGRGSAGLPSEQMRAAGVRQRAPPRCRLHPLLCPSLSPPMAPLTWRWS